jgi:hypothetical protein
VSLIRGAHQHLSSINKLPNDFNEELLKVMQTTSTQELNQVFSVLETQKKINDQLPEAYRQRELTIDQILSLAETTYLNLVSTNDWLGVNGKGDSTFVSQSQNCWNCGKDGHDLRSCPHPRNEDKIAANKSKFWSKSQKGNDNGRGGRPGGHGRGRGRGRNGRGNSRGQGRGHGHGCGRRNDQGTFSTPTGQDNSERTGTWCKPFPHENNRRIIKGKPYKYNEDTKRWILDQSLLAAQGGSQNQPAASLAVTDHSSVITIPSSNTSGDRQALMHAAIANATRTIDDALHHSADQFT